VLAIDARTILFLAHRFAGHAVGLRAATLRVQGRRGRGLTEPAEWRSREILTALRCGRGTWERVRRCRAGTGRERHVGQNARGSLSVEKLGLSGVLPMKSRVSKGVPADQR
jgi:hypothetical protein